MNKIISFFKKSFIKCKNIFKQNKKMSIMCLSILIVIVLVLGLIGIKALKNSSKDNRKELTTLLEQMGKEFYEDYLYDSLTENDKQNFLERISVTGLKLDLDNLGRYDGKKNNENLKKFINSKTETECSKTGTFITIYANAPYEKSDYNIEVTLDCGFED